MKKFDLELAKQGKPVTTKDGSEVRILTYDAKGKYPIVALVKLGDGELAMQYDESGVNADSEEFSEEYLSNLNLMMVSEKHEGYINLYKYAEDDYNVCDTIYGSYELAHKQGSKSKRYVKTIKIEWED